MKIKLMHLLAIMSAMHTVAGLWMYWTVSNCPPFMLFSAGMGLGLMVGCIGVARANSIRNSRITNG